MVVLFAGLFGLAVLYFWLAGGQFARILAFLAFSVAFSFVAVLFFVGNHGDFKNLAGIGAAIMIAWCVASFPIEYQRSPRLWRRSASTLKPLSSQDRRGL